VRGTQQQQQQQQQQGCCLACTIHAGLLFNLELRAGRTP
jgi:hypothetical protein